MWKFEIPKIFGKQRNDSVIKSFFEREGIIYRGEKMICSKFSLLKYLPKRKRLPASSVLQQPRGYIWEGHLIEYLRD